MVSAIRDRIGSPNADAVRATGGALAGTAVALALVTRLALNVPLGDTPAGSQTAHADRLDGTFDDDHHAVRRNALISLFKFRGEDADDDLLEALEDSSERVREWAAHMLAGIDSDVARDALQRTAETDDSGVVRTTAANALQEDPARFRRSFRGALADRDVMLPGEDLLNRQPDL